MLNSDSSNTNIRYLQPYQQTLPSFNELLTSIQSSNKFRRLSYGFVQSPINIHHYYQQIPSPIDKEQLQVSGDANYNPSIIVPQNKQFPPSTLQSHPVYVEQVPSIPTELHESAKDLVHRNYIHSAAISHCKNRKLLSDHSFTKFRTQREPKYTCDICLRSFTTSGHRARHNRTHTGERKHLCPWPSCDAKFSRRDNCMQHYKTHNNRKRRPRRKILE